jgi:hypothetical protein
MNDVECGMSRDRDGNFLLFWWGIGIVFAILLWRPLDLFYDTANISLRPCFCCFFRLLLPVAFFPWFKFLYAKW